MRAFMLALIVAMAYTASAGAAQGVTGLITGHVADATGGLVPGAAVTLTNTGTNKTRKTLTGGDGGFVFVDLLAGTYQVTILLEGFKTIERKEISVAATEHVNLPPFILEVGTNETITVRGDVPLVQTATSAHSGTVTRDQIESIALKGRDVMGTLSLLPGIVDTNPREAPSWNLMNGVQINGRSSVSLTYDGVDNRETESNALNLASPALDSIAELRVQTSNFQAEYGRSSGASITVVTRSGSKDFRGSAAFYKRDTALNGNEFSRKQQCREGDRNFCEAAMYRFDNYAWTLGGPVLVPGTSFNSGRNRLFFFWSQDLLKRTDPGAFIQRRMPTAKERVGDFSETYDAQGRLINIRDPLLTGNCNATGNRGLACFPDNVVPAGRIDPIGQAILNLFPLPNATDPSGRYNYTFQMVNDWPRDDQVLRLDWNAGPRTTVYGRVQWGYENRSGNPAPFGFTGSFPRMASRWETEAISYVNTLLHTINPTTFVEATAGVNWGYQHASPMDPAALDANTRALVLPGFPAFLPAGNPLDLLPNASFAGVIPAQYAPIVMYERRFPFSGDLTLWNFTGSLTKVRGPHNIKTGVFVEHSRRPVQRRSAYNGNLNFGVDTSHPFNTNLGFANALLGTVTSYQKADRRPIGDAQFLVSEFYAQDTWRVQHGLTVDAGVRFHYMTPTRSRGDQVAQFEPSQFDPAQAPLLFQPVLTADGRRARNPVTGQDDLPAGYVGQPVPGTGNLVNGTRLYDGTPHRHSPFAVAPRAGFAWNVTGDGRSSIRGGIGVFYDRYPDNDLLELLELPPLVRTYTLSYTTMADLVDLGSRPLTETTSAARRIVEFVPPVVYGWSLGAQRDLGWNVVGDLAYVGNAARHQPMTRELNGRPYGYTYQPSNLDPTNPVNGQAQPFPDDFLRPYRGYSSITQREFTGYGDYHSVQVLVTRRQSKDGLSGGAAYTYQIVNKTLGAIDPFLADNDARHYNSVGRRPHTLTLHYSYRVPNPAMSTVLKAILHGWQVSGVTSMLSGAQGGFGYSYQRAPGGTLSGTGSIGGSPARPRIICDPYLPRSQRTFDRQFRTECIAAPDDPYNFGTARGDEFHGPGFVNWDMSLFKHIPLGGTRELQLRVELYNAFNTDQWTTVDTTAQFDYSTRAQISPTTFGSLTGLTNSARRIQLGARLTF